MRSFDLATNSTNYKIVTNCYEIVLVLNDTKTKKPASVIYHFAQLDLLRFGLLMSLEGRDLERRGVVWLMTWLRVSKMANIAYSSINVSNNFDCLVSFCNNYSLFENSGKMLKKY